MDIEKSNPTSIQEIAELIKNNDLSPEEVLQLISRALDQKALKRNEERDDIAGFAQTITEYPPKIKAYALAKFYYDRYAHLFGENEYLILLISRGGAVGEYYTRINSAWKSKSIEVIKKIGYSLKDKDTGETKEFRPNLDVDVDSIDIENSDPYKFPDFWGGDRNEASTIDSTMIRVAQWCNIHGYEGYWKRLYKEIELSEATNILDKARSLQWLYSHCRCEKSISLMKPKLDILIFILTKNNIESDTPWKFVEYNHKLVRKELHSSALVAASLIFCIYRLNIEDTYSTLIDKALSYLLKAQLESGGWKAFSINDEPSIETTALCIHALAVLGLDVYIHPIKHAADWLCTQQDPWGFWFEEHSTSSSFLTVLVLDAIELSERNIKSITFDFEFKAPTIQIKESLKSINNIVMGDQYNIDKTQAGAIGREAKSDHNSFQQINYTVPDGFDFKELVSELGDLKKALKDKAEQPEDFVSIAKVVEAEKEANNGNYGKVVNVLKSAGNFVLDTAKEIGVGVVTELIMKQV